MTAALDELRAVTEMPGHPHRRRRGTETFVERPLLRSEDRDRGGVEGLPELQRRSASSGRGWWRNGPSGRPLPGRLAPVTSSSRRSNGLPIGGVYSRHYTAVGAPDLESTDAAILCGTALMDTGHKTPELFRWLLSFMPGARYFSMLALAAAFGGTEPCCGSA